MDRAWTFVDFFFVLSGFVIANAYMRKIKTISTAKAFMIKRLFRLYPLHFVTLIAVATLEFIGWQWMGKADPFGANWPTLLFLNLTLSHAVGFASENSFNVLSWSIGVEFYAYLAFCCLCLCIRNQWLRSMMIVATVLAALFFLVFRNDGHGLLQQAYSSLARGLYGFGLGCLVSLFRHKLRDRFVGLSADVALVLIAVLAGSVMSGFGNYSLWLLCLPPLFALFVLVVVNAKDSVLIHLLETSALRWLGQISYSIYLTQTIYMMVFSLLARRIADNAMDVSSYRRSVVAVPLGVGDLLVLAYVVALIAGSWLTYRLIENPGRKWGQRLADNALRH
jgi:peptidoglycan/LPS O-acetylase OafA/YrhL